MVRTLEQRLESIQAVKVAQLPAFLREVMPVAQQLLAGDWISVLGTEPDRVIKATAIGANVPREWLDEQDVDTLVSMAARVVEVNADFFVRRVLPTFEVAAERVTKALEQASQSSAALRVGLSTSQPSASTLPG